MNFRPMAVLVGIFLLPFSGLALASQQQVT